MSQADSSFSDHCGHLHCRLFSCPFHAHLSSRERGLCVCPASLAGRRRQLPAWVHHPAQHALSARIPCPGELTSFGIIESGLKADEAVDDIQPDHRRAGQYTYSPWPWILACLRRNWVLNYLVDPRVGIQEPDQSDQTTGQESLFCRLAMAQRPARLAWPTAVPQLDRCERVGRGR